MTKSDLVTKVAERLPYLTQKDAEIIVNMIFDTMGRGLSTGERIEIRGLGSFTVKRREAREGRNPKTGQSVQIPAKRLIHFKVGKELNERINRNDI